MGFFSDLFGGPSQSQKQLSGQQGAFFNNLMSSFNTSFAGQQSILNSIQSALSPILNAGPNQNGFSAAQNAALTSNAINNTATQARNAQVIAQSGFGGNTGVTTGGEQQLQAAIASRAGENLSNTLNSNAIANAELGRQNFFNAENALSGAASIENPTGMAGQATGAGNAAFGTASKIQQERQAAAAGALNFGVGLATDAATMGMGGIGNLDTTGGSTGGEQVMNFLSGMGGNG